MWLRRRFVVHASSAAALRWPALIFGGLFVFLAFHYVMTKAHHRHPDDTVDHQKSVEAPGSVLKLRSSLARRSKSLVVNDLHLVEEGPIDSNDGIEETMKKKLTENDEEERPKRGTEKKTKFSSNETVSATTKNATRREDPSLFEYYYSGGVKSGLTEDGSRLLLNGKPIQIISGAIHYFRIHPNYWRTSLRKLKVCGMNAVETYVPWNLHEPLKDTYDFGDGSFDMSYFLNLKKFLTTAEEEDLFVIIRPGPYICSEWDFGGLPSYLLRDPKMRVRTSYPGFLERVDKYFKQLMPILHEYQWMPGNAGPIIAAQIENEYGSFLKGHDGQKENATKYLAAIRKMMIDYGLDQTFLFFSDPVSRAGLIGGLDGVLMTANFQGKAETELTELTELQPNRPIWVMELWTGWFDHWLDESHKTVPRGMTMNDLDIILNHYNGSLNLYMFQGGTNFGFFNGANMDVRYAPDTTSYDYDAPLTESGDYTSKYELICNFIGNNSRNPKFAKPEKPAENRKFAPSTVMMTSFLALDDLLLQNVPTYHNRALVNMENLGTTDQEAQDYGFILYRKRVFLPKGDVTLTLATFVHDMVTVMINGVHQIQPIRSQSDLAQAGYWLAKNASFTVKGEGKEVVLDLLAENLGRVNWGPDVDTFSSQRKGLVGGQILVNGKPLTAGKWEIRPLSFKSKWVRRLIGWKPRPVRGFLFLPGPKLLKGQLILRDVYSVPDTWVHLSAERGEVWKKGVVFVNGFNLGRYWDVGPQQTLYLPGPLLRRGSNEIIIFEVYQPGNSVSFSDRPIYGSPDDI